MSEGASDRTRFLQHEVTRLESENERLRALTEAMAEVQRDEILEYERQLVFKDYPDLKPMAHRLKRCDTVDEIHEEVEALLDFRDESAPAAEGATDTASESSPAPTPSLWEDRKPPVPSVASSQVGDAPAPLSEAMVAPGKELLQERRAVDDPAARLVAHRRRRRRGGR